MKKIRILALFMLFMLAMPALAFAEGFAVYEWGARGIALGGSTVARTPDPSAISSNPAAITRLEGKQAQVGLAAVMPFGKIGVNGGGDYKVKERVWLMPSMYYTQQLNDKFSIGVGEFSRFGLGFDYGKSWPGGQNIYRVKLQTASVNPNVAYKVNDKLSVALGVEIMWLDITLKKRTELGSIGFGNVYSDVSGDNFGVGGNIALHYQFDDQWATGIGYRSPVRHHVKGESKFNLTNPAAVALNFVDQDVEATVTLPESITTGVSFAPTPKLSFEISAIWTRWSRFTDLDLEFERSITGRDNVQKNPKYWKNTWRLGVGVEYALTDWVDLRAGYVWDQSPMRERHEDYLIPTDNRHIWSVGSGFKLQQWVIDVAYAYVDPRERRYQEPYGDHVLPSRTKDSGSHVASLSVSYKF